MYILLHYEPALVLVNYCQCIGMPSCFRLAYLHSTLAHSESHGQGRVNFYCEHLVNARLSRAVPQHDAYKKVAHIRTSTASAGML